MPWGVILPIGIVFGLLAAVMAFLIIFEEYRKHKLGRGRLWREALSGGALAFAVFVVIALVAGYWLFRAGN